MVLKRRGRKLMAKKRVYKKRGYKTVNVVGKSLNPLPQRYICKMKYAQITTNALGGGNYGTARFNLNSIFDPDQQGIGRQPYARDTFASLYNRYRVINCSYRISAVASDGSSIQVAVIPTNEAINPGSISEVRENPRAKYTLQGLGAPLRIIKGNVYIPSLMGRTKAQYMADDRFQAQMDSNPAELAYLSCYAGLLTEGTSTISVTFNVLLEYTVECFDIKHLPSS